MKTHERQTIRSPQTSNPNPSTGQTGKTKPHSTSFKTAGTGLEGNGTLRNWCPLHQDEAPPKVTVSMMLKALVLGSLLFVLGAAMMTGLAFAFGM